MTGPRPLSVQRAEARRFFGRWRYALLLGALTAGLYAQVALGAAPGGQIAAHAIFSLIVIGAAAASKARPSVTIAVAALAVAHHASIWAAAWTDATLALAVNLALAVALAAAVILLTVEALLHRAIWGADAIAGAAFGYLLLGVGFGFVYAAVEVAAPGTFTLSETGGPAGTQLMFFSLITLSNTGGYGEVVPQTAMMRLTSAVEAAAGALYLVALIGRVLGVAFDQRSGR